MQAPLHPREPERLAALALLDPQPSAAVDDIVERVCELLQVPIALVSVLGATEQRFVASHGLAVSSLPPEVSFCAWTVHRGDVLEVPDARADPRFANNPLVLGSPFVASYTGVPLRAADGLPLGTLCVLERRPRALTPAELGILMSFARHVESHLLLAQAQRRLVHREAVLAAQLEAHEQSLNAHHIHGRKLAHDVRNMTQVQRLLIEETAMLCRGAGSDLNEVIGDLAGSCTRLEGVATTMSKRVPSFTPALAAFDLLQMVREAVENLGPAGHAVSIQASSISVEGDRDLILPAVQHVLHRAGRGGDSVTVVDAQGQEGWGVLIRSVGADWSEPLPAFCVAVLKAHNGEAVVEEGGAALRLFFGGSARD